MRYPYLQEIQTARQVIDTFGGYNHNYIIRDNEFFEMENMSSDEYPLLSVRGGRRTAFQYETYGIVSKDMLCFVDGSDFVAGKERIPLGLSIQQISPTTGLTRMKQLVSMGAYVIIFPDRKYVNTADLSDYGSLDAVNSIEANTATAKITACNADGTALDIRYATQDEPEDPDNMAYWADMSCDPPVLRQWSAPQGMWVTISVTHVKIEWPGVGNDLKTGDGVELKGFDEADPSLKLNGSTVITAVGDDFVAVQGNFPVQTVIQIKAALSVARRMPDVDFVVESRNRLWGCKYGQNEDGEFINQIYASKLGDFKNWTCFQGLSTDSYFASVGSDGPFTGAVSYLGYPHFFKEGCVHRVYGEVPSSFSIQETACKGVQRGCEASLAVVDDLLYYKSQHAVVAYDGAGTTDISYALGNVSGAHAKGYGYRHKYYLNMRSTQDGIFGLYVYDAARSMWHREDSVRLDGFCAHNDTLYAVVFDSREVITLAGGAAPIGDDDGKPIAWAVQTGIIGTDSPDTKYISRILVRMQMDKDAKADFFVQYDSCGTWQNIGSVRAERLQTHLLPLRPRRCDHMRIRIEGTGRVKVFSFTKTIEQGGDVP